MKEYKNLVCKGSYSLGTACGNCERCMEYIENMNRENTKAKGDYIELSVDDFEKLLLCARTCKDDYFIMRNLLAMKPLEETTRDCIVRMKFREPIFTILEKFRDFKI